MYPSMRSSIRSSHLPNRRSRRVVSRHPGRLIILLLMTALLAGTIGGPITDAATPSFAAKQDFATGAGPNSVAVGDLNGDGKLDLALANISSSTASVLLNTTAPGAATPSFAAKQDFATDGGPASVTVGDLNGDGKLDLAVGSVGSNTVSVLLNTTAPSAATPSFAAKQNFATAGSPFSLTVGDLNGDGKLDLAVANNSSNNVSVLLNTTAPGAATPSFAAKQDLATGATPESVTVCDLNGDGKLDLVVANFSSSTVSVLLNTTAAGAATPSFAAKQDFAAGLNSKSVIAGDLNGDGQLDLAVANQSDNTVSVLLNTIAPGAATPSFAAKQDFAAGLNSKSVTVGDLNGDGKLDLAVANTNSDTLSVLFNTTAAGAATPGFAAKQDFTTGAKPYSVTVGDMNGDAKLDLVVANALSNTVSVLLNTTTSGDPIIVNTTADVSNGSDGLCTLREAISASNSNASSGSTVGECVAGSTGPNTISISVAGTINLTNPLPDLASNMTINGLGTNTTIVQRSPAAGTPNFRIFNVTNGKTVTISKLTVTNGRTADAPTSGTKAADGGAILNSGTLNLSSVVLSGNRTGDGAINKPGEGSDAGNGGAIFNSGLLNLTNSTVSGNLTGSGGCGVCTGGGPPIGPGGQGGDGGGIANVGTMTISNSTINGNETGKGGAVGFGTAKLAGRGGGIFNTGTLAVINTTIDTNKTGEFGGALTPGAPGGGICNASGVLNVVNSTIVSNKTNLGWNMDGPGGGVFNASTANIANTIVANNLARGTGQGPDLSGTFNSQDYNLIKTTDGASFTGNTSHNITGSDPNLGPLANNGGSTQTRTLLTSSLAIDAGSNANLPPDTLDLDGDGNVAEPVPFDQRGAGFKRIADGDGNGIAIADIGAFEAPINPIDEADFFVQRNYRDFLNREPDTAGLDFWTREITSCGSVAQCIELKRISVSGAFYVSIEFQTTGYLVERLYKTAYGDANGTSTLGGGHQLPVPIVRLNEFLPDTQKIGQGVIVGQAGWETMLENNRQAFTLEFVQRSRFTTALPTSMTPTDFVTRIFINAGVLPTLAERQAAINEFGSSATTADMAARSRALRDVAENSALNQQEFNRAFVLMEFFGYLRRNPNDPQDTDYTGYDFWLTKLNQFNGNFVQAEMVKAFINSGEYRNRFGP